MHRSILQANRNQTALLTSLLHLCCYGTLPYLVKMVTVVPLHRCCREPEA